MTRFFILALNTVMEIIKWIIIHGKNSLSFLKINDVYRCLFWPDALAFWQGSTVFIFRNVDVLIKVPCISPPPPLSIAINFCHINTHKTVLRQEVTLNFYWVLLFCSINIFFYTSICHLYFYLKWYQNIYEIIYCINVFQLIKVISAYNNRSARAK